MAMRKVELKEIQKNLIDNHIIREDRCRVDSWYYDVVSLNKLFSTHSDFRGFPFEVGKKYVDIVELLRPIIDNEYLRYSPIIKKNFDKNPILVIEDEGKLFVLDGQLRVITACYHKEKEIKCYIFRNYNE